MFNKESLKLKRASESTLPGSPNDDVKEHDDKTMKNEKKTYGFGFGARTSLASRTPITDVRDTSKEATNNYYSSKFQ